MVSLSLEMIIVQTSAASLGIIGIIVGLIVTHVKAALLKLLASSNSSFLQGASAVTKGPLGSKDDFARRTGKRADGWTYGRI